MQIIGLTGGIASGKSTVHKMLLELGATLLDADAIYHQLIAPKDSKPSELALLIQKTFPNILGKNNEILRSKLGQIVFGHPEALKKLGSITHPAVAREFQKQATSLKEQDLQILFYDVPLLFERGMQNDLDGVIVVWIPSETQKQRLKKRNQLTDGEVEKRIASQFSLDEKKEKATWVIDNSKDIQETERQVKVLWALINKIKKAREE